jgi:protein-disulfide isomerase
VGVIIALMIVLGGGWYFFGDRIFGPAEVGGKVNMTELMKPSPLGENVQGAANAPVTIIEYASTTCPHCAHFHATTYPELKKRYIDTGKVRFIFREFPLNDIDFFAYMLTRCIGKDKFFPFLDVLFSQQDKWVVSPPASPLPPLTALAKQVGFTDESIEACRKDKSVFDGVTWSSEQGTKLGVRSTPTFFIDGKMYSGDMSIEQLDKILAPLLKS